jgi:hypothetical protein
MTLIETELELGELEGRVAAGKLAYGDEVMVVPLLQLFVVTPGPNGTGFQLTQTNPDFVAFSAVDLSAATGLGVVFTATGTVDLAASDGVPIAGVITNTPEPGPGQLVHFSPIGYAHVRLGGGGPTAVLSPLKVLSGGSFGLAQATEVSGAGPLLKGSISLGILLEAGNPGDTKRAFMLPIGCFPSTFV